MQIEDKEATQTNTQIHRNRRATWRTGLSALVGIALLVGLGATVFAYSNALRSASTTTPQARTWQRVLNGYSIISLIAAPSKPTVLYACGAPSHPSTLVPYRPSQPIIINQLLGSVDGGTTWQTLTNVSADCQIAVNPTNSNDIYLESLAGHLASNGQVPTVLRHSTDGGHSWTDISPTFTTGNTQLSLAWHIQQLSMVGDRLFGIQMVPAGSLQPTEQPSRVVTRLDFSHLVESSDGGHTWTIFDSNLGSAAQAYSISFSESYTIYELAGPQWFPYRIPETPKDIPTFGNTLALYKTTNDGGTWTKLLANVPYGSKIQQASNTPSLIYVVGQPGTQLPNTGQDISPLPTRFLLKVSKNSGATWDTIETPAGGSPVQNWFVDADGQVYITTGAAPSGQPTGTIGKIGTKVSVATSQIKQVENSVVNTQSMVAGVTAIQRYNVTNGTWTAMKIPANGELVAVTISTTQHKAVLWFLSDANNSQVLYRELI